MTRLLALAVVSLALAGCVVVESREPVYVPDPPVVVGPPGPPPKIPPGHMPPRGACRIWYPDRPPGHQPPPGRCEDLRPRVPPGAYLIRG
jgi:hypothetical protein